MTPIYRCRRMTWSLVLFLSAALVLPSPGHAITIGEEEDLSAEMLRIIFKKLPVVDDPYVTGYVNRVGKRILSVMPEQPFRYRFYVINQDMYNAFATPAGHIFIYSGLMKDLEGEEELAGILGHEIAHVSCRHISEKIDRSKKIGVAALAGMAAGVLLGAGGAATAAQAVTAGTMAATQSLALSYSREDEMQADQVGLAYLTQAGYTGKGLYTSLKKIRSREWYTTDQVPTYLRTHPASEDRLIYLGAWLDSRPAGTKPTGPDPWPFQMARIRLAVLYGDETAGLTAFQQEVADAPDRLAARYGLALALARHGNWNEAINNMRAALQKKAFDAHLLTDLGRLYYQQGRFADALKAMESAAVIGPDQADVLFWLARTLMVHDRFAEAADALEKVRQGCPNYHPAIQLLGEAYGRQGRMADAHYNLGIYHYNRQDDTSAVHHLARALENGIEGAKREEVKKLLTELKEKKLIEEQEKQQQRRNRG